MTYETLEARLFSLARHGMKLGLDRMERALAALGDPHRAAPVLHVAGTNGKGSTCAFLDAALREAGLRTGLYTSPHLERFAERFRVDGVAATESQLVGIWDELGRRVPGALAGADALTFFELTTLLGFLHFARERVQVQVLEVGLGGRLDATNVVRPVAACITSIGLEHREFLGDTLAAIAGEKAGIVKPGVPAIVAAQEPEAAEVVRRIARERAAPLAMEGADFSIRTEKGSFRYDSERWHLGGFSIGLRGPHQLSNAAVAVRALEEAAAAGLPVTAEHARRGLRDATWPGRLETVRTRPEAVLDGAHNPPAARALARSVRELFAGRRVRLVLGILGDKDAAAILRELAPVAAEIVVTAPASPRALPAADLAALARPLHPCVEVAEPAPRALELVLRRSDAHDVVLVCGSLYLVGEVRAALRGEAAGGPAEILRPGTDVGAPRP